MKKSIFHATAACQALALMGAGMTALVAAAPAAAQDYTSGSITGTVTNEAGNSVSGATVTLTSKAQGFTQTATTSASGNFRFSNLTSGEYDVSVAAPGSASFRAESVSVLAGQTASLDIKLSPPGEDIVVVGSRIQAFEGTTTGLNVDVEELVNTVPVERNLTSVILLAPGTSSGDSAFGNLASVGGSSVAENAYYINGLNITNFDNYLGSATVPFSFYKSIEVKSGGYPAEFGRATGGIVNAVTKSGTNDYKAAVHLNWSPDELRSSGKNIKNCEYVGAPEAEGAINCTDATNRRFDSAKSYSAIVEAGGPILRDRLFLYGLVELRDTQSQSISRTQGTAFRFKNNDPFWGVKVDAYPIDNHHFEFTLFDTRNTTERSDVIYNEDANGRPLYGIATSVTAFSGGGVNYVGKYTGRFTDFLTVSAAYGRMRDRFDNIGIAGAAGQPYVRNLSGAPVSGVNNGGFFTGQRTASIASPYNTERKFYRGDVDVYASLFGDHHFRAGFDVESNTLEKTTVRNAGNFLFSEGNITADAFNAGLGNAGLLYLLRPGGQVELNYFNSGGAFDAKNRAVYLQDEWKVTDALTINAGIRRDDFAVNASNGKNLVTLKNNWAPRIGVTYDLFDGRGKARAFYGQYYLPFASNTAFRMTGTEFFFRERFLYNGFDSNGIPNLGAQVTNRADFQSACPFPLTPLSSGSNCSVTGDGSVDDSSGLIAHNLKATKQEEYILGYEHKFGRWNLGVNLIHRKLLNTAEDAAIDAAVLAYCAEQGIAGCENTWTGFHQYVILNPGQDLTVNLLGLDGRVVTFAADKLGYPKATRTYDAVELTFDRPYDGVWSLGGSYTWSKSKGNSEGFVQSDFGQADAGITQDFDQPGFNDGAYGYLPNDRRHRFKLYGAYTFDNKFTLGTNMSLESPRSLSCFGFHPTDVFARLYGAASHYCDGVLSPRGKGTKTDWISNIDVKAAYTLTIPTGQKMTIRADVFNLLNSQSIQERNEFGDLDIVEDGNGNITNYIRNPNYNQPTGYQSARAVRIGLDIEF